MNGAFPLLGDAAYVTYVGALAHRGANPTTHLAEVRYPVQTAPVVSVVKLLIRMGCAHATKQWPGCFCGPPGCPPRAMPQY